MKKKYILPLFVAGIVLAYEFQTFRLNAATGGSSAAASTPLSSLLPVPGSGLIRLKSLGTTRREMLYEIRGGDFAHAGDAEAIDLVWGQIPIASLPAGGTILDIGCGAGGTLKHIYDKGARGLMGIDIDPSAIKIAAERYGSCANFMLMNANNLGTDFPVGYPLSLTLSFNSFYAFDNHPQVLTDLFKLTLPGGYIAVFDYAISDKAIDHGMVDLAGKPMNVIHPPTFTDQLTEAGWQIDKVIDLDATFKGWYEKLTTDMDAKSDMLVTKYGMDTYEPVYKTMNDILTKLQDKRLGGALFIAQKPA